MAEDSTPTNNKSRAEYFRQRRRKNSDVRNDAAERDAKRKRNERGGYKSPSRQYREYLSQIPEDKRELFRVRFEYPHLFSGDVDPAKLAAVKTPPLSQTANARRRRLEELKAHYDYEQLLAIDQVTDEELRDIALCWASDHDPDDVIREMRGRANRFRSNLQARRKDNARRQVRYRAKNLEKVREAEKIRTAARRAVEKAAREQAPFIAIDAEGCDIGEPQLIVPSGEEPFLDLGLPERSAEHALKIQNHRTFLWGASGQHGSIDWLGGVDRAALSGRQICAWLASLPKKFPGAIFVMFAAGYDWTQIFRDMGYEKGWELWNALPWSEHDQPTGQIPNRQRFVLWHEFALRLYPGKYIEIGQLRDRNKIRDKKGKLDFISRIKIFDTFGFFQSSFLKAAKGFGGNSLTAAELKILEDGKLRRREFNEMPLAEIMNYTMVELRVLGRIMTSLRDGLRASDLKLRDWHGAGCIAQAMMNKDRVHEFYPEPGAVLNLDDLDDPRAWGFRAYFGGRVEMMKQGVHEHEFFNYDISSAYPHNLRQLPNMRRGDWKFHDATKLMSSQKSIYRIDNNSLQIVGEPLSLLNMRQFARDNRELNFLLELLNGFSLVSMVRVQFLFPRCRRKIISAGQEIIEKKESPWFPLPVRANDGTIYFPDRGQGIYFVAEVRAMLRWAMSIYADAADDELPTIAFLGAMEFIPINDALPFKSRIEKDFAERAKFVEETTNKKNQWEADGKIGPEPYDVREKILKLGMNSIYGKTAQSIGARVVKADDGSLKAEPPRLSNIFYAAATTAGARAMLVDAASSDPDAIILFATDGICATRQLSGLEISQTKQLGTWEISERKNGVFVKAGIYSHEPFLADLEKQNPKESAQRTTKMRGIRPTSLPDGMTAEQWLIERVPDAWRRDEPTLTFPYQSYKTIGAAMASRESWKLAGHWIGGQREADIQHVSIKRDNRSVARMTRKNGVVDAGEKRRAFALFDTTAAPNPLDWDLSRPFSPDWLDQNTELRQRAEDERKTLECKSGFGFETD